MKINTLGIRIHTGRKAVCASLLLLAALILFPSAASAQSQYIILPVRELSLGTVVGEIERQTDLKVDVNRNSVDIGKRIFFPASRLTLKEVLDHTLAGTGCGWDMTDGRISIAANGSADGRSGYGGLRPQRMTVVPDPWATRDITQQEISRIERGYRHPSSVGTDSLGLTVLNFRVNSSLLERDYMDNARMLDVIHNTFSDRKLLGEIDFITVTAAASPEGNTGANARLAAERAKAVKTHIVWKFPFMDRNRIFTFSIGEDWAGLYKMVEDDPHTPYRQQILDIIGGELDGDAKRARLKSLGGGEAYRYLADNMLPWLRGAAACMIYYKEDTTKADTVYVDRVVEVEKIVEVEIEKIVEAPVVAAEDGKDDYYFAVKTNLLYDLALLPDLALEFSLGNRWSIEVGGQWSWWNTPTNHKNCWRIQVAGIEGRKWLGGRSRTPLTGHFLGLYGMAGTYDVRFNNKTGYLSNMSYSAGLSYGYSLPLGRSWNMEFGISVGYLGGKYKTYGIYDEINGIFPKKEDKRMHYFGPTKARASLVWLVGSGKNQTKGK